MWYCWSPSAAAENWFLEDYLPEVSFISCTVQLLAKKIVHWVWLISIMFFIGIILIFFRNSYRLMAGISSELLRNRNLSHCTSAMRRRFILFDRRDQCESFLVFYGFWHVFNSDSWIWYKFAVKMIGINGKLLAYQKLFCSTPTHHMLNFAYFAWDFFLQGGEMRLATWPSLSTRNYWELGLLIWPHNCEGWANISLPKHRSQPNIA